MNQKQILGSIKTIAVVGLSDDPGRYSHQVAKYMQAQGYRIIPVNPNIEESLGEKAYPDLLSVPDEVTIDLVDIFRKSEAVLPHVKEAVKRGDAKVIWMQEGVVNKEAETYAKDNDLEVVVDSCIMVVHQQINK